MANELESMLARMLKPRTPNAGNAIVERLETLADSVVLSDGVTADTSAPESRVGFATLGYSEVE